MLEFCTSIMSKSFVPYLARMILDQIKAPVNRQVTKSATLIVMFIFEFKKVKTGQILTSYTCLKILLTKDSYAFSQRTFGNSFVSLFLTKLACLFQLLLVHFVFYFMICETVYHLHKGKVKHSYDEALLRWKSTFLSEKFVFVGKQPLRKSQSFLKTHQNVSSIFLKENWGNVALIQVHFGNALCHCLSAEEPFCFLLILLYIFQTFTQRFRYPC